MAEPGWNWSGVYRTLVEQLDALDRRIPADAESIQTRRRHRAGMLRFLRFAARQFFLQKLAKISNKHLAAWVAEMLQEGRSPGYIAVELSAVRFYHSHVLAPRRRLTRSNAALGVPPRNGPIDRAWTRDEISVVVHAALAEGKVWIADVLIIFWETGLRIHEVVRLDVLTAHAAVESGILVIKGKGGLIRRVPVAPAAKEALFRAAARVGRGKLFVPAGKKAHQVIAQIQQFIRAHRSKDDLTAHGLRYSFAQRCMHSEGKSAGEVSRLLGHRRPRVTRTYVGPWR